MGGTSLGTQLAALLQRNFLIKTRVKKHTFQEIFWPIYFILILAAMKLGIKSTTSPPISSFPENALNQQRFYPSAGLFLVSPDTPDVTALMDEVFAILEAKVGNTTNYTYTVFPTPEDAEQYFLENEDKRSFVAGVDFADGSLADMNYTLRMKGTDLPSTNNLYGGEGTCRAENGLAPGCPTNLYLVRGFAHIQLALDTALVRLRTGLTMLESPELTVQMLPQLEWNQDIEWFQVVASIYFVLAYAPFVSILLVNLVTEKEKKIKEGMKMMGLKNAAFWIAWMLTYLVIIVITTSLVVLIAWATRFYTQSNMFIFWLTIFLYGLSIIMMSFMFTPFFNKALSAGGAGALATLLFSLLYLPVSLTSEMGPDGPQSSIPEVGQWFLCLLSPVALSLAIDKSIYLDIQRGGMTWSTIKVGQFPLENCLIMLTVDIVLYALLAVYFDNVVPSEYGQRQPLYFCFMPSYWCGNKKQHVQLTAESDGHTVDVNGENLEPISDDLRGKEAIRMFDVKKTFTGEDKKKMNAVDGFTLDIYEGQITCLLGHNGAGKTTLINILTGMTPLTSGAASIYGLDVNNPNDMGSLREQTGICPQHNILYDFLSCVEHLRLFAKIKGVPKERIEQEIEQALDDVDLAEQANVHAAKLSGGQKRKLSVAVALIGDPKVLFLDEPTAGMDPYSRRHLWSLLKNRRPGRVILLTTHFMDEADILADRKAFISRGRLQCVGSSLYLKNKFGVGYHLSVVLTNDRHVEEITQLITSHVPSAAVTRSHGKELDYTLPLDSVSKFADLFSSLEQPVGGGVSKAQSLGVSSYGVSMTSLEEVFMKIGVMEEIKEEGGETENSPLLIDSPITTPTHARADGTPRSSSHVNINTTPEQRAFTPPRTSRNSIVPADSPLPPPAQEAGSLWKQQFWAIVKVRLIMTFRNKITFTFRVIMPVVFAVIGLCISKFGGSGLALPEQKPLYLNASLYSSGVDDRSLPNVTYQFSPPYGLNGTDFVDTIAAGGIGISGMDYVDFLNNTPHHQSFNIYDITMDGAATSSNVSVQYNATALHSIPSSLNLLSNTLLRLLLPPSSAGDDTIITASRPWPNLDLVNYAGIGGAIGTMVFLGMAILNIPPGMGLYVVLERQYRIRSQLRIAGVSMNTYWAGVFFSDAIQFGGACLAIVIVMLAFRLPAFMYGGAILCMILLLTCYIPTLLFLSYCMSFLFNTFDGASSALSNIFFFGSFMPYIAVAMLDAFGMNDAATGLHILFTLIDPPYGIYGALQYISRLYMLKAVLGGPDVEIPVSEYFKWENNILITIIAPIFHALWLFFLLRFVEVKKYGGDARDVCMFGGRKETATYTPKENTDTPDDEDVDVLQERERVKQIVSGVPQERESVALLHNLRKEFGRHPVVKCGSLTEDTHRVAVRNSTMSVETGEVLGLLGPNGAGKTTTLNCMIAEEGPTAGTVKVAGEEVRSTLSASFHSLGYCPQHDPLWEDVTLKEHLSCFANIKGVPKQDIDKIVNYLMDSLKITEHADKISKKLSGGTKRKLSYALSMLGNPSLVLLDEPSTGMDPQSKRFLWDTISAAFAEGGSRGAVLTTHYMEEADALCSRVAIMVNGQMQCIGSTQHLKDRHGSGYILEVKLGHQAGGAAAEQAQQQEFGRAVEELFPGASMVESFGERITFRISRESVGALSRVFAWFEEGREKYGIEEYSFSQATLEQVFLEFAKKQEDENAHKDKKAIQRQQSTTAGNQNQSSNNVTVAGNNVTVAGSNVAANGNNVEFSGHMRAPVSPVGSENEAYTTDL